LAVALTMLGYSTLGWVRTEMGDRLRVYCLRIRPDHPGQLSLVIILSVSRQNEYWRWLRQGLLA